MAHVGDSRAYLYRDGRARQLTEDHSWIQEQVRAGLISPEEAKESRFRNIITRSVGFEPSVEPDLQGLSVQAGDCFVLCSDGLSNYLTVEELAQVTDRPLLPRRAERLHRSRPTNAAATTTSPAWRSTRATSKADVAARPDASLVIVHVHVHVKPRGGRGVPRGIHRQRARERARARRRALRRRPVDRGSDALRAGRGVPHARRAGRAQGDRALRSAGATPSPI